jgi:hypothetical protein
MSTATKITTIAEVMGDSGVIVYANGPVLIAWDRKQTLTVWDTMQKRLADSNGWGWNEYEVAAVLGLDDSDKGVDQNLAWAMDKAADWYEEHGEEY